MGIALLNPSYHLVDTELTKRTVKADPKMARTGKNAKNVFIRVNPWLKFNL